MIIENPQLTEHFGAVSIHSVQKVLHIDTGVDKVDAKLPRSTYFVSAKEFEEIESQMAVVISIKNERLKLLMGALGAIPQKCLIIVVSNSSTYPINRYKMEVASIEEYTQLVPLNVVVVHQRDPGIGELLKKCGYEAILDKRNIIRNGKAEGMLLGTLLAWYFGKKYVGFIDSDNYVPGAVHEYVKDFAAGFVKKASPYVMVRIAWIYKPKYIGGEVVFKKLGRISKRGNYYLNLVLASYSGFDTEIIRTANAGEHAMTIDLAKKLRFSHGFSIEPYQYMDMFEQFGGVFPPMDEDVMEKGVNIYQIETKNPHFHEDKGDDHLKEMYRDLFSVIYHSPITQRFIKKEIEEEAYERDIGKIPLRLVYPPLEILDFPKFKKQLKKHAKTLYHFS